MFHSSFESRVLLNPGDSLLLTECIQCYCIADDLDQVFHYKICVGEVSLEHRRRQINYSTFANPVEQDMFQPMLSSGHEGNLSCDELSSASAYTAYTTPNYANMKHHSPVGSSSSPCRLIVTSQPNCSFLIGFNIGNWIACSGAT